MWQRWELDTSSKADSGKPAEKPRKKKANKLDLYLRLSISVIIIYVIVAILFQYFTQIELSTALTAGVFAFFGTEIGAAAFIKVFNLKKEEDGL